MEVRQTGFRPATTQAVVLKNPDNQALLPAFVAANKVLDIPMSTGKSEQPKTASWFKEHSTHLILASAALITVLFGGFCYLRVRESSNTWNDIVTDISQKCQSADGTIVTDVNTVMCEWLKKKPIFLKPVADTSRVLGGVLMQEEKCIGVHSFQLYRRVSDLYQAVFIGVKPTDDPIDVISWCLDLPENSGYQRASVSASGSLI